MKIIVEIEFEGNVNPKLVPSIISNHDAVQLLGENIKNIKVQSSEDDYSLDEVYDELGGHAERRGGEGEEMSGKSGWCPNLIRRTGTYWKCSLDDYACTNSAFWLACTKLRSSEQTTKEDET